jgi:hypothetical protein
MSSSDINAQIDALVAASAALNVAGADMSAVSASKPGLSYNSETGETIIRGEYDQPAVGQQATPIHDTGRALEVDAANVAAEVATLQAKLDAHKFDPITGTKVYEVNGDARELLVGHVARATERAAYFNGRINALAHQRTENESAKIARLNEQLARSAFSRGDATRAKAFDAALAEGEATIAAAAVLAARKANR